jgi:hypothetical protein
MNETVKQTTELLKELSNLNKVQGRLLSDPESREEAYEGRKTRQQEIRQELVKLATLS